MPGWAIFLTIVLLLPLVAAVIFFALNGLNALQSARAGDYGKAIFFAALALVPAAIFFGSSISADMDAASRARKVVAFSRTPLPQDRPRTLEIYDGGHYLAALALGAGRFDKVFIVDSRRYPAKPDAKVWEAKLKSENDCEAQASAAWDLTLGRTVHHKSDGYLDRCIERVEVGTAGDATPGDAIVFLEDSATTMAARDKPRWSNGNYEIRIRRGGEDLLVDYWEQYYYQKLGLIGMETVKPKRKKGERPFQAMRWFLEKIEQADDGLPEPL